MSHKHGKKRTKEAKPTPAEQKISTVDALKRIHEVLCVIMCNTCEKKETCVVRMDCILYSDEPPKCPSCGQTMEKKDNIFICSKCTLENLKKKRMEEIKSKPYMDPPEHERVL